MEIKNKTFDEERALYGSSGITVTECAFDGPCDGESAFKESSDITARKCFFNLRYPFWHCKNAVIEDSEMTSLCRAAIWYTQNADISLSKLHGTKAVRECEGVKIYNCDIDSQEFGWFCQDVKISDSSVKSEYFMLRSGALDFNNVTLCGKYSFQYVTDSRFENCNFDTKDAFWHAKNVVIKNSVVKGEYLGWYCENVTFENCTLIGTQPLCYCKNLKLINCKTEDADLAFERSEVEADITSHIISIKNPISGYINVQSVGELIECDGGCIIR